MKIIYNNILPPKGFTAINLFGVIFVRKRSNPIDKYIVNHEAIHTAQVKELLFVPFYIFYILEWVIRCVQYKDWKQAYYNISFEREAYTNHCNLEYLNERKWYEFRKYLVSKNTTSCK